MKIFTAEIKHGDCVDVLTDYPDNAFDLIVTSPPYADKRKNTYGGVAPDKYVEWFENSLGDYIDWSQAIENAINKHIHA